MQHRLGVGEDLEPGLAVVGADAARAHTTERQLVHRHVKQRVIVPRGDDQHRAERLLHDASGAGTQVHRHAHLVRLRPRTNVVHGVVELVEGEPDLGRVGLDRGLPQIGVKSLGEHELLLDEQPPQLTELRLAVDDSSDHAVAVSLAHSVDGSCDLVD